jgi:hypothetical protein
MDWDDYLRDEARKYRKLAEQADDPLVKQELLELADICDKVANNIEDHMTAGRETNATERIVRRRLPKSAR